MIKKVALLGLTLSFGTLLHAKKTITLNDLERYAASLPESVKSENDNWLWPDYTKLYKKRTPSSLTRWARKGLRALQLKKKPAWSPEDVIQLLQNLVAQREQAGYSGQFVEKLNPNTGSQLVIWGDLFGAFHSLLRDLRVLVKSAILDESLQLQQNAYLIFNGNVISRSPYLLETLSVVLMLMERNPNRVFFMRGNLEQNGGWLNFGLKHELQIRLRHLSKDLIPFGSLIDTFFNTLPFALYVQGLNGHDSPSFIRISALTNNSVKLDNGVAQDFLNHDQKKVYMLTKEKDQSDKPVPLSAVIKGIDRSLVYGETKGLQLLMPEKGATAWTAFSSPTAIHQNILNFYYDSFSILSVTSNYIKDWTLTLFNRDVRKPSDFQATTYNVLTGQTLKGLKTEVIGTQEEKRAYQPDLDKPTPDRGNEIVVGSINDFSKSSKVAGDRLRSGLSLRINQANREGEIPGKKITLIVLDDQYTPYFALQAANELLHKYKTNVVIQTLGTPTHEALLPLIREGKLLVLFNFGGASIFRGPELTHNMHARTSYAQEAKALVDYAFNQLKVKSFAVIYQEDSFGYALRDGAREEFKKLGITRVIEESYPRNTLNIDNAAKAILKADPEAILCFGTKGPYIALVEKLGAPYFAGKFLMGPTFLTDVFRTYLRDKGLEFIISRVVPDPRGDTQIAKEYRAAREKYDPGASITVEAFEAYINASLFVEALKHIQGPVTKEKLIAYFQGIKDFKYKGLILDYDPKTQELTKYKDIWIDTGKEWIYVPGIKKKENSVE